MVHSDCVGLDCGLLPPAGLASWLKTPRGPPGILGPSLFGRDALTCGWVFCAPASMPGDVLLFQRLSVSTIGAVRFHGRVRDGIGWVTDAMVTKQWSGRVLIDVVSVRSLLSVLIWLDDRPCRSRHVRLCRTGALRVCRLVIDGGTLKHEQSD